MIVESAKISGSLLLGVALLLTGVPAEAQKKPGGGTTTGCSAVTGPPTFAYSIRSGKSANPQIYVADASGACSKFVFGLDAGAFYPRPHSVFFRMLPAGSDGVAVGRIATYDQIKGLTLAQFRVDVNQPGMNVSDITTYVLRRPAAGPTWPARVDISHDGSRVAYVEADFFGTYFDLEIYVYDVAAYLDDPSGYAPTLVYSEALNEDDVSTPRWGSDGRTLYLERFKNGDSINPSIARLVDTGSGTFELQNLIDPVGPRLALFDVQPGNGGDDVIVFGESTASAPYCYLLATATCTTAGTCARTTTAANVSFYTSAESGANPSRVLTQPVTRRDCVPSATIVRTEATSGGTATVEPLVGKGEWPSSAR